MKINLLDRKIVFASMSHSVDEQSFLHYGGRFVFESSVRNKKGNWSDDPHRIYYTEKPKNGYSKYYALGLAVSEYLRTGIYICSGESMEDIKIEAIEKAGMYVHSASCHDFCQGDTGFIDGGRDYTRTSTKTTTLKLIDGDFYLHDSVEDQE